MDFGKPLKKKKVSKKVWDLFLFRNSVAETYGWYAVLLLFIYEIYLHNNMKKPLQDKPTWFQTKKLAEFNQVFGELLSFFFKYNYNKWKQLFTKLKTLHSITGVS